MGTWGKDGSFYNDQNERIRADERWRQQEEQNRLLKEQNRLTKERNEELKRQYKEEHRTDYSSMVWLNRFWSNKNKRYEDVAVNALDNYNQIKTMNKNGMEPEDIKKYLDRRFWIIMITMMLPILIGCAYTGFIDVILETIGMIFGIDFGLDMYDGTASKALLIIAITWYVYLLMKNSYYKGKYLR